jgi:hypothetical protein
MKRIFVLSVLLALASPVAAKPSKSAQRWGGPDLGFSCETVRWAWRTFPHEWLEAQAKARGITRHQRSQAKKCLSEA